MKEKSEPAPKEEDIIDTLSENGWLRQAVKNNTGRNQVILKFLFRIYNNLKGINTPLLNSLLDNVSGFFSIKTIFWVCTHPLEFIRNVKDLYRITHIITSEPNRLSMVEKFLNNEKIFKIFQSDTPGGNFFGEVAYEFYDKIFLRQVNRFSDDDKVNKFGRNKNAKIDEASKVSKEDFVRIINKLYIFAHKNAKFLKDKEKLSELDFKGIFYAFVEEFYGKDPSDKELQSQKQIIIEILHPILIFKIKSDIFSKSNNQSKKKNVSLIKKIASLFQAMEAMDIASILSSKNQRIVIGDTIDLINIVAMRLKDRRPNILSFENGEQVNKKISLNEMNKRDLINIIIQDSEFIKKLASLGDNFTPNQLNNFLLFIVKTYVLSGEENTIEDQLLLVDLVSSALESAKEADMKAKKIAKEEQGRKPVEDVGDKEQQDPEKKMIRPIYLRLFFPDNSADAKLHQSLYTLMVSKGNLAKKIMNKFRIPFLSNENSFEALRRLMQLLNQLDRTGRDHLIKKVFIALEKFTVENELLESLKNINTYEIFEKIGFRGVVQNFSELEVNRAIGKILTAIANNFDEAKKDNQIGSNPSYLDFYKLLISLYKKLDINEKEILFQLAKDYKLIQSSVSIEFANEEISNSRNKLKDAVLFFEKFLSSDFAKLIMFKKLSRGVLEPKKQKEACELLTKHFVANIGAEHYDVNESGEYSLTSYASDQMNKIWEIELDPKENFGDFMLRHLFADNETPMIQELVNNESKQIIIAHKSEFKRLFQRWAYKVDIEKLTQKNMAYYEERAELVYDISIIAFEELVNYRKNFRNYRDAGLRGEAILALNILCNEKFLVEMKTNGDRNIELIKEIAPTILAKFGPQLEKYVNASQNLGDMMIGLAKILDKNRKIYNRENGKLDYKKLILELEKLESLNGKKSAKKKIEFKQNIRSLVGNVAANLVLEDVTETAPQKKEILITKKILKILSTIAKGIEYTDKLPEAGEKTTWQSTRDAVIQAGQALAGKLFRLKYQEDGSMPSLEKIAKIEPFLYYYNMGVHANSLLKEEKRNKAIKKPEKKPDKFAQNFERISPKIDSKPESWLEYGANQFSRLKNGVIDSTNYLWEQMKYSADYAGNVFNDGMNALFVVIASGSIQIDAKTVKDLVVSLVEDKEFLKLVKDNLDSIIIIMKKTGLLDETNLKKFENTMKILIKAIENRLEMPNQLNETEKKIRLSELVQKSTADLTDLALIVSSKLLSLEMEKPPEKVQSYYRNLKIVTDQKKINVERMDLFQELKSYRDPDPAAYLFSQKQFTINNLNMIGFEFSHGKGVKYMNNVDFTGINMNKSVFERLVVEGCNFKHCNMKDMRIESCEFGNKKHTGEGVVQVFEELDLSGAKIEKLSAFYCLFKKVTLKNVKFYEDVKFESCFFKDVVFENCDLRRVDLSNCRFENVVFNKAILTEEQKNMLQLFGENVEIIGKKSSNSRNPVKQSNSATR